MKNNLPKLSLKLLLILLLSVNSIYALPPTITSFTPISAKPGDVVTLSGTNFNTTAANNIVFFGATRATVTGTPTTTSLTVTVPTGANYAPITLLNTATHLVCYSRVNFTPKFSPAKSSITTTDFLTKVDFSTGSNSQPYSAAIGDLDGDGKPDLAVVNANSANVSVYYNTATSGSISVGSFAAPVNFTTGTGSNSIVIGDLDGDGKLDLVIVNGGSDKVSVFRNTSISGSIGLSSFATKVDFATGTFPYSVAIGDLDGDGKPDLATANSNSSNVSVLLNTSTSGSITSSSFASKVNFTTGSSPQSIAIGDLDGDSKPDLAIANWGSDNVSILRNTATSGSIVAGSFATKVDYTTGANPTSVKVGDLDSDGKPDLAITNENSANVSVLRNTSNSGSIVAGSFANKVDFATGTQPQSIAIGDLDGDGKPDLVSANGLSDNVSILRNTSISGSIGVSSFATKVDFTTGIFPSSVAIGDMDGDGRSDMVLANPASDNFSVLRNAYLLSNNANLSALSISSGTLSPSFSASTLAYADTVVNTTSSVAVTPTKTDTNASIQVRINGGAYATVTSGSASSALSLNVGSNTIDVTVTAQDGTTIKTYTITVTRALPLPTITSFTPSSGSVGSLVTITGTNLSSPTALTIGGVAPIAISNTGTSLVAMLMPGATTGTIALTTTGGNANSNSNFTVIASIPPNSQQGNKLVGTGNAGAASQGYSVAVSADGNTAIVGGQSDNNNLGAAWVYTRSGDVWNQQGSKLVGTGSVGTSIYQGHSVSISADGNTAMVGGYNDNTSLGAVWVYTRSGIVWTQQGSKLVGTGSIGQARQGISIKLSADGNTAIVGGYSDNNYVGAAWVYNRIGGAWSQFGNKLVGTGYVGQSYQGISVGISANGNTAIVGGINDNNGIGAVWVYTRTGGVWSQQGSKLVGTGSVGTTIWQGNSVNISADGNTAIAGGYRDNTNQGAAWVYTRSGGVWSQQGSKLVGTGSVGQAFQASSVSISADGKIAIVSAYQDNSGVGAFWLYTLSGGLWSQQGSKLVGSGNLGNSNQGLSACISANGNTAIVGGYYDNNGQGAAWMFNGVLSADSNLSALSISAGTLSPSFFLATIDYTASVTNATSSVTVTPIKSDANASIQVRVNGGTYATVNSGSASGALALNVGSNTIDVKVTAQNGSSIKIYTITVTRALSPPSISSFTPISAKPGDVVTLTGTNFNTTAINNIVFFGATKASVSSTPTTTSMTVIVPSGATYAPITLFNTGSSLACYSRSNFTPKYSPAKTGLTTSDFSTKQDFTTGTNSNSVAIGDLDVDGKPDLAVVNSVSNTISVYRNTASSGSIGAGSFASKVDFTTGANPSAIAIGDLDGDGKPDLVVANANSSTVSVFRNMGSSGVLDLGSFSPKVDFTTGYEPTSVAIGDLDGDGKPDLVVSNASSNSVSVLHNTFITVSFDASSFDTKVDFATGSYPFSVAMGDLDGDGKPDLIVANKSGNTVSVLRNTSSSGSMGSGSFAAKVDFATSFNPRSVAIVDLDGDGKLDLVTANIGFDNISVLRNTATSGSIASGSFATKVDFSTGLNSSPTSVSIGDLDGDGKPDLAVANNASMTVSVFRNTATSGSIASGSFASPVDFATSSGSYSVAIGDLDGDGRPDLAATNFSSNTISVFRNADILSNNANLSALLISSGTLSPSFTSATVSYTASVTNATSSVTATPTKTDANANIQVRVNNGTYATVSSGSASGALSLNVGSNTIDITVTAQDGVTIKTYTTTVTRAGAGNSPTITSFTPTSGSVGSLVTITGTNLSNLTAITIGGVSAITVSSTGTDLVAMVMPGANTSYIGLTNSNGNATSSSNFVVTPSIPPAAQQGNKLVGTGVVGFAVQAIVSLSADGNTAIVGGIGDDGANGAVWIYTRSGALWSQQGNKLVGTGNIGAAWQGYSVALSADGNTAVVGGIQDDNGQGAVWIFTRTANNWSQQGNKLVGTGGSIDAKQGTSVSLSADGSTALVGGIGDSSGRGAVWVFTRNGINWTQQGGKLVGTGSIIYASSYNINQGQSVALSADGNTAIVGGSGDDFDKGATWVFVRNGNTWTQQGSKMIGSNSSGAAQGYSVSLSADGNTALVGGYRDNYGQGAAWVFVRSGSNWTQLGNKITGSGYYSYCGQSVSLSADGNTALMGGWHDNNLQGATWLFTRSGNTWTQQGNKIIGSGGYSNASQGYSVSLSADGNTSIVGGYNDNNGQGAVWVFNGSSTNSQTQLTLTAFLEGSYLGNGSMTAAPFSADGISPMDIADTITIELHQSGGSHSLEYSSTGLLNTTGLTTINFPSSTNGKYYYIVVKHRNSIETWSADSVLLSNTGTTYDFSSFAAQSFGDNMSFDVNNGLHLIYSGDINQDGAVDFNDYPNLDISSSNGVLGYDSNDLNGDASVDFNDYPILDINSSNGVLSVTP